MNSEALQQIGRYFLPGFSGSIEAVGSGLIHRTYKLKDALTGKAYALQQVNTSVFPEPQILHRNYHFVAQSLLKARSRFQIPEIIVAPSGHDLFVEGTGQDPWRIYAWVENSITCSSVEDSGRAYAMAGAFGRFSADLLQADPKKLQPVLPGFHDLALRFRQLETAVKQATPFRLNSSLHLLQKLEAYTPLLDFYRKLVAEDPHFRRYIMHHDAKISNILFDSITGSVITPVDLDTVMPGYFFSDFGDMVRSLAPDRDENAVDCSDLQIRPGHYQALREGYLEQVYDHFSDEERRYFDYSGLLLACMQSLRFLTDHLNGDAYYRTDYEGQNLQRAENQYTLLIRLEDFLVSRYNLTKCSM